MIANLQALPPWWGESGNLRLDEDGVLWLRREDADEDVTLYRLGRVACGSTSYEVADADAADYERLRARWLDGASFRAAIGAGDRADYQLAKGG